MRTNFRTAAFGGRLDDGATRPAWHGPTRLSTLRRSICVLGLVTAATLAFTTVTAAPAEATASTACAKAGCYKGSAIWTADGDKMLVCDGDADGYSVLVMADISSRPQSDKWHTSGAGKCTERSYGDVGEGQLIVFQVCLGKQSTGYVKPRSCGDPINTTT